MRKMLILSLFLMIPTAVYGGRLIRIPASTDSEFTSVRAMGYDVAASNREEGYIDVMVSERFVDETMRLFPEAKLLPLEWSTLLPTDDGEMGCYYGPNENAAFWATLAESSDLVDTPASYGQSFEGRELYYVRITNASSDAPAILFTSLLHGREPGGNSVMIDWGQWLATEYGSDTMATYILDNAQVYIVPIMNPDAYEHNNPSGGNQRKNMNWTTPVASSGIDLNRNYSVGWGYDDYGSSPDPYSETYRGSAAASEPETYIFTDWFDLIDPLGGMFYHTYGGDLLYPYAYNNSPTPDEETFESWAIQLTSLNGYAYGRCGDVLGYPANGDAIDWSYGEHQAIFYTPEVDDNGFWGSQSDSSLIVTNNAECRYMNKLLCMNLLNMSGVSSETSGAVGAGELVITLGENPVSSVLSYAVSGPGSPSVTVLDVTGRTVALPENGVWTVPSGLTNGVYFLRADNGSGSVSERFTVLR